MVGLDGVPIGPQWLKADGKFFLGADRNGRDIMVRLLYGGRNSLMIGVVAALMTTFLSILLGVVAGYFRGPDGHRRSGRCSTSCGRSPWSSSAWRSAWRWRWAACRSGRSTSRATRSSIPIFIIGLVYVPYMARPVRGQVLSLREKEFVEAARAQGAGPIRIMFTEVAAEPRVHDRSSSSRC